MRLGTKAENRKDGEEQMICPRCGTNKFVVNRKPPVRLPQVKPAGDYTLAISGGVLSKIIIIQSGTDVNKHLF